MFVFLKDSEECDVDKSTTKKNMKISNMEMWIYKHDMSNEKTKYVQKRKGYMIQ